MNEEYIKRFMLHCDCCNREMFEVEIDLSRSQYYFGRCDECLNHHPVCPNKKERK